MLTGDEPSAHELEVGRTRSANSTAQRRRWSSAPASREAGKDPPRPCGEGWRGAHRIGAPRTPTSANLIPYDAERSPTMARRREANQQDEGHGYGLLVIRLQRGYLPLAPISTARTPTNREPRRLGAQHTHPSSISSASSGVHVVARGCSAGIFDSAASGFPLSCCPRRTKQERRHPNEKVLRVAQYADGRARGAAARRGRQRLPFLRLLLGKDGLAPRLLLPATYGGHTTRNGRRRGDHPRYREAPRGTSRANFRGPPRRTSRRTSRANPRGIACGHRHGLCLGLRHGLPVKPSDETLSAFPSPVHRASWMGLFSGVRGVYPGDAGSSEVDLAHGKAPQLPKAMGGPPAGISATRGLPLGRGRRPRRRRAGASGYAGFSRHPVGRARLGGVLVPRAKKTRCG